MVFVGMISFPFDGFLSPPFQVWNLFGKQTGDKSGETHLHHLVRNQSLHGSGRRYFRVGEFPVYETVAAIIHARRTVGVRTAAFLIPLQWHPAALTILVGVIHIICHLT
jgi:hypothetical protein